MEVTGGSASVSVSVNAWIASVTGGLNLTFAQRKAAVEANGSSRNFCGGKDYVDLLDSLDAMWGGDAYTGLAEMVRGEFETCVATEGRVMQSISRGLGATSTTRAICDLVVASLRYAGVENGIGSCCMDVLWSLACMKELVVTGVIDSLQGARAATLLRMEAYKEKHTELRQIEGDIVSVIDTYDHMSSVNARSILRKGLVNMGDNWVLLNADTPTSGSLNDTVGVCETTHTERADAIVEIVTMMGIWYGLKWREVSGIEFVVKDVSFLGVLLLGGELSMFQVKRLSGMQATTSGVGNGGSATSGCPMVQVVVQDCSAVTGTRQRPFGSSSLDDGRPAPGGRFSAARVSFRHVPDLLHSYVAKRLKSRLYCDVRDAAIQSPMRSKILDGSVDVEMQQGRYGEEECALYPLIRRLDPTATMQTASALHNVLLGSAHMYRQAQGRRINDMTPTEASDMGELYSRLIVYGLTRAARWTVQLLQESLVNYEKVSDLATVGLPTFSLSEEWMEAVTAAIDGAFGTKSSRPIAKDLMPAAALIDPELCLNQAAPDLLPELQNALGFATSHGCCAVYAMFSATEDGAIGSRLVWMETKPMNLPLVRGWLIVGATELSVMRRQLGPVEQIETLGETRCSPPDIRVLVQVAPGVGSNSDRVVHQVRAGSHASYDISIVEGMTRFYHCRVACSCGRHSQVVAEAFGMATMSSVVRRKVRMLAMPEEAIEAARREAGMDSGVAERAASRGMAVIMAHADTVARYVAAASLDNGSVAVMTDCLHCAIAQQARYVIE